MDTRFFDTTGKRLRLLRMERGLKQGDVARLVGIRHAYMSEIENDKARPSGEVIATLADVLHTSTDFLLLRTNDPGFPAPAELEPAYA